MRGDDDDLDQGQPCNVECDGAHRILSTRRGSAPVGIQSAKDEVHGIGETGVWGR